MGSRSPAESFVGKGPQEVKLVTAATMRAIDTEAIERRGIPGLELMENAGRGIAEGILENILGEARGQRIGVICGKGNNGGDGFVAARHLFQAGCKVKVFFPAPSEALSPDARHNYERALESKIPLRAIENISQMPQNLEADFIIDAVFGTGFSGVPRGLSKDLIDYINNQDVPVIAVDCPSGLDVDTGRHEGSVVKAMYTFSLAAPKIGLYYSPGRELAGQIEVIPIGIPDDIFAKFDLKENLITPEEVGALLPQRKPDGHKGDFGKLFILAGSTGLTGAATLAAMASARTGLGLVTVGCPKTLNPILEVKLTEPMTYPLPDVAKKGFLALRGLGEIKREISQRDAVVIGPGIGRHRETIELVQRLVVQIDKPAIVDADGLFAFAKFRKPLEEPHGPLVLTPHPGEFSRLIEEKIPDNIQEIFGLVRKYAQKYRAVIVLKGSPTIVVDTDGRLYLNPTGNDGMATGGTGDVLSGMIGSFLAQGLSPLDSAVAAVYIHGLAGDLAAEEMGRRCLIAGDLLEYLPEAFSLIESGR